jgi:outer membrane protein OmpA-like peptidoglycan-associated protein
MGKKESVMPRRIPDVLLALLSVSLLVFASSAWAERGDEEEDEYAYDDEEYDEYDDEAYDEEGEAEDDADEDEYEEYEDEEASDEEAGDDEEAADEDEGEDGVNLAHPSFHGETGLFHVVSAGSGDNLTFSTGIHMNFFTLEDWLVNGDDNTYIGGTFHFRLTVWDYIEAYFAVVNYANSNPEEEPQLFQTLGDMVLGVKGFYPIRDWFILGGGVGLYLLNTVGDVAFAGSATSVALRVATTFDIKAAYPRVPLRFHLNFEYFFDNSAALVADVERRRASPEGFDVEDDSWNGCSYDYPDDPDSLPDDDAGCITRIERTALHISRLDTAWLRLGIEVPLPYVTPIVELNVGIPANRQGFNCVYREGEEGLGTADGEHDSCYDVERGAAMPMWMTLGARVEPWVPGLAVNLAVDIGLTGTRTFVQELPAVPPYMVYLGLSYSYNPRRRVVEQVREVEVEVEAEPEPEYVINGRVIDAENHQGIASAVVSFPGTNLTRLASNPDGSFRSWSFSQPGAVAVHVEHPDYRPADCTATFTAPVPVYAEEEPASDEELDEDEYEEDEEKGEEDEAADEEIEEEPEPAPGPADHIQVVNLECTMTPLPRRGTLVGHVTDEDNDAVAAATVVIVAGDGTRVSVTTDTDGAFDRELLAGSYSVQVEAEGFLRRGGSTVEIAARQRATLDIQLRRQPRAALVRIQGDRIQILRPVHFRLDSAEIDPDSHALLEQVADVILRNPEFCHLEIQGHTDSSGTPARNRTLSEERAASVREFLTGVGVSADRLASAGYGPDRPVAPNITAAGRSRNRRVEIHITERCPAVP